MVNNADKLKEILTKNNVDLQDFVELFAAYKKQIPLSSIRMHFNKLGKYNKFIIDSVLIEYFIYLEAPYLETKNIVVWLDILGFSNLSKTNDFFVDYLDFLLLIQAWQPDFQAIRFHFINDAILLCMDMNYANKHSLYDLINQIIFAGFTRNILIRGALVVGNCRVGNELIYGAGLIDAHTREKEVAIYPRVIISEDDIKQLPDVRDYCLKDIDGFYCFNWFSKITTKSYSEIAGAEIAKDPKQYFINMLLGNIKRWAHDEKIIQKNTYLIEKVSSLL
jgi:hypothetical protein